MKREISKTSAGVKINFFGSVEKQHIVKIVENCATGKCDCMNDETKAKIHDMKVDGSDGDVQLDLEGNVSVSEIREALSRSKVIDQKH